MLNLACTRCGYRNAADISEQQLKECITQMTNSFVNQCRPTLKRIVFRPDLTAEIDLSPSQARARGVSKVKFAELFEEHSVNI